jgi:amino acid transporter
LSGPEDKKGGTAADMPTSAVLGGQSRFRKVLSFQDMLFLALGGSIGSAWLFGSVYGASAAGPASIVSWLLGGAFILVIAITWAEVGGMVPSTGAVVKVPQYAHGYMAGFYSGWAYYLSSVIVPPVEAVAIVTYSSAYFPSLTAGGSLTPAGYVVSLTILMLMFLLNSYGVRIFSRFNTGITWWKIFVPTATIIAVLAFIYPPNFSSFGGFAPRGIGPVFSAVGTSGIVFAYTGFRAAMDYSGESRNPRRDVPRAMVTSVVITIVLYTLLEVAFIGGIRWGVSGVQAGDWAALSISSIYSSAPFYHLVSALGIGLLATVLLVDSIISPLGTVGVYVGSSARDLYALAEEGGHPATNKLSEVDRRYGVPRVALLVSFAIGIGFLLAFPNWEELATIGTSSAVFTYLVGSTALVIFRKKAGRMKRGFRVPMAGLVAPVAFVMSSLIFYWTTWPYTGYSVVAFMTGFLLFGLAKSRGSYPSSDVRQGSWLVVYSVVLAALSYAGSYGTGALRFPFDFVVVGAVSLGFYYWGIHSGFESHELKGLAEQQEIEGSLDRETVHVSEKR